VPAKVIGSEPAADLSLLQLERVPVGARPAVMANSDTVRIGDSVIIVGAPYGLRYSLSNGIISARWAPNTVYRAMPMAEFFQTTATINTGNSGGPMFNEAGEVIGIVSHNISKSGGSEGLGFVVTLNESLDCEDGLHHVVGSDPNNGACPAGTTPIGGTMTRFDFPGADYTQVPTPSTFAIGGFRGDLAQVGPDGCIYGTQAPLFGSGGTSGTRYDDLTETSDNSLVQICGGFVIPPGVTREDDKPAGPAKYVAAE